MISTSTAIKDSATAQARRIIYVRRSGNLGLIISDGRHPAGHAKAGKWHIIDICFGNTGEAIRDLQAQGYTVKEF